MQNVFATGNDTWQIQQYACISIGRGNCSDTNVLNCGPAGIPTACGLMPVVAVVQMCTSCKLVSSLVCTSAADAAGQTSMAPFMVKDASEQSSAAAG